MRLGQCPGCLTAYTKSSNCEKLRCVNPRCGTLFCFICCAPYAPIRAHGASYHRPQCKLYVNEPV